MPVSSRLKECLKVAIITRKNVLQRVAQEKFLRIDEIPILLCSLTLTMHLFSA